MFLPFLRLSAAFALLFVFLPARVYADENTTSANRLKLDTAAQKGAGLQTVIVEAGVLRPEYVATARALGIQPLLELRARYRVALAEQAAFDAQLRKSAESIKRTQTLFNEGIAARRILEEKQALWRSDKAQRGAQQSRISAIEEAAKTAWGSKLSGWTLGAADDRLREFVEGSRVLLLVTLPTGKTLASRASILIDPEGNRRRAQSAEYLSAAPQSDETIQGQSYFFFADDSRIRPGMTASAWLADGDAQQVAGVTIPDAALVWSMDQAFVYVKTADDAFSRRPITHFSPTSDGYLVQQDLRVGEEIVSVGAQQLLSQEFRGQIPDEDD